MMDSRRFGVFLVAIFLFASLQVPATAEETSAATPVPESSAKPEISTTTVSSTTEKTASETPKPITSTESSTNKTDVTPVPEISTTAHNAPAEHLLASTTESALVEPTTTKAPTETTTTKAVAETPKEVVTTKPDSVSTTTNQPAPTNSQNVRDVEPAATCSSGYQALVKENLIPEKVILTEGMTAVQFCNQSSAIEKLKATCASMNAAVEGAEGAKTATIVSGLAAMFSSICSNAADNLPVVATNGKQCSEALVLTTKKCTTKSTYSYPTEMLYHEMMNSSCTMLDEFKSCIAKDMESSCSSAQQQAVSKLMAAIMKEHQCSSTSTTKAPMAPEPTPTPKSANVIPPRKSPDNSGSNFQLSIFTLLPVLLSLAFKFY